jgi:hypothetical protein
MCLIDNEDTVAQAPQAQHLMPRRQDAKQRLVDGTNADMRQECLAPIIGNPGSTCGAPSSS